jgi:hypothetical protein
VLLVVFPAARGDDLSGQHARDEGSLLPALGRRPADGLGVLRLQQPQGVDDARGMGDVPGEQPAMVAHASTAAGAE